MHKIKVAAFLLFFYPWLCPAQPDGKFEEFGRVTTDDVLITECSFEKGADAMMLFDLAEVYYEKEDPGFMSGGRFLITTSYYQRYKVFTERGCRQADFRHRFRSGSNETITEIKAASYNLDADGQLRKTELIAADIHFNKINEHETEVVFSVPGVKTGCVFEIAYKRGQYVSYTLPGWYFNSDVPTAYCSISIGFLDPIQYYIEEVFNRVKIKKTTESFVSDIRVPAPNSYYWSREQLHGKTISYIATNIQSVHDEPFMNSRRNYMDRIGFQLREIGYPLNPSASMVRSWNTLNSYLLNHDHFGANIQESGIPKKQWKDLIRVGMTIEEMTKVLFEFIRSNMNWNGIISMTAQTDDSKIWKNKSGSTGEINLLLLNTLRNAGLPAYPMIVGTRAGGYLNTDYPLLDQFRNTVVMVELSNDKKLILDASDKFLPFGQVRYDILNNYGYVIRGETDWYWHRITNEGTNSVITSISAALNADNFISGNITIASNNYSFARLKRMKTAEKEDLIMEDLKKQIPNITIESYSDSVNAADNFFIQNVKFTTAASADNDGNIYISLPAIYGEANNPFVSEERISAIDFGYRQKESTSLTLEIPEGYEIDSLFKPQWLITEDTTISFLFDAEDLGTKLIMGQRLDYKRSLYSAKEYPSFYEFHRKYFQLRQQPVILLKKK